MRRNHINWLSVEFGDILTRPKFPFIHKGVYVGDGQVLQNTPGRGEHITDVAGFANGKTVSVKPTSNQEKPNIFRRVTEVLAHPKPYDHLKNNCEHTATRITEGKAYSTQLAIAVIAGLSLIVLAFAARRK